MAKNELTDGMKIEDGYVVIVKKIVPRLSKSEKSMLLASTGGKETFTHDGKEIHVNLNVYTPKEA